MFLEVQVRDSPVSSTRRYGSVCMTVSQSEWGKEHTAASLKTSAANLHVLHSGSKALPRRWANSMVAMRPVLSCMMVNKIAAVGVAVESPTPTPTGIASQSRSKVVHGIGSATFQHSTGGKQAGYTA